MLNFEVASFVGFLVIYKHRFVTAAEAAAADFDVSIKRNGIDVSLKNRI